MPTRIRRVPRDEKSTRRHRASRIAIESRAAAPGETMARTNNSSRRDRAVDASRDAISTPQGRDSCRRTRLFVAGHSDYLIPSIFMEIGAALTIIM